MTEPLPKKAISALTHEENKRHNKMILEKFYEENADLYKAQPEPVEKMREMMELQGQDGTWNYDPYFHGMYNGMEFMLAMVEDREPVFRSSPSKWLGYTAPPKKEWVGLTEDEATVLFRLCLGKTYDHFWQAIEAKLKEKNT